MNDTETSKRWQASGAPVQADRTYGKDKRPAHPFPLRIPWHFHERAWSVYAAAGHGSQSAVRMAERGGFGVLELVACIALGNYHADYDREITAEHVASVRNEIEEWTSGSKALAAERDEAVRALARMRSSLESLAAAAVATPWVAQGIQTILDGTEEDHPHDQ